jgi:ribosomal-protein-serine acetyltransferase
LPWLDWSHTPVDTAEHIRQSRERYKESNGFSAGIWTAGKLAGAIGLHAVDSRHRSSSIGYWLSEDYRGAGIMTQACRAVGVRDLKVTISGVSFFVALNLA